MVEKLKAKIKKLEVEKEKLRGSFEEYELTSHLEVYIMVTNIDFTISVLKQILIEELQ